MISLPNEEGKTNAAENVFRVATSQAAAVRNSEMQEPAMLQLQIGFLIFM